jgi:hypothetical protein
VHLVGDTPTRLSTLGDAVECVLNGRRIVIAPPLYRLAQPETEDTTLVSL